jgi:hypothetical protein
MRSPYGIAALLAASLLWAGCATVDRTPLTSETKKGIRTIAVIDVPEPEKYFLMPGLVPGGPALYVFGAIGGLVLGSIEAARLEAATDEFTAALKPTHPDVARHWNESVSELLRSKGFEVTRLPPLPNKAEGDDADCSSIAGKFDAVLLSTISAGYAVESAVEPRVYVSMRLASGNCSETHFSDSLLFSAKPIGRFTHVERDAKFAYPSREALIADPLAARDALRAGLAEIARRTASDL